MNAASAGSGSPRCSRTRPRLFSEIDRSRSDCGVLPYCWASRRHSRAIRCRRPAPHPDRGAGGSSRHCPARPPGRAAPEGFAVLLGQSTAQIQRFAEGGQRGVQPAQLLPDLADIVQRDRQVAQRLGGVVVPLGQLAAQVQRFGVGAERRIQRALLLLDPADVVQRDRQVVQRLRGVAVLFGQLAARSSDSAKAASVAFNSPSSSSIWADVVERYR